MDISMSFTVHSKSSTPNDFSKNFGPFPKYSNDGVSMKSHCIDPDVLGTIWGKL